MLLRRGCRLLRYSFFTSISFRIFSLLERHSRYFSASLQGHTGHCHESLAGIPQHTCSLPHSTWNSCDNSNDNQRSLCAKSFGTFHTSTTILSDRINPPIRGLKHFYYMYVLCTWAGRGCMYYDMHVKVREQLPHHGFLGIKLKLSGLAAIITELHHLPCT